MTGMNETIIAPSLLSADFARLSVEVERTEEAGADWHHVDVMDGHFVPNLTIGPPVVKALSRVAKKPLDVHLMISDPWQYCDAFIDAGAAGLSFHAEVLGSGDGHQLVDRIKSRGVRACLVVNPDTPIAIVKPYLGVLDMVLVMSVQPGFGGQKFRPDVLPKVETLRKDYGFTGVVQMDGGISRDNVARCAAAGTNSFVAGSALFGAEDMKREISVFRQRIAEAGGSSGTATA